MYFHETLIPEANPEHVEILKMVLQGINSVQFTLDIAFDIFYCLLVILYSIAMINDSYFGKIIGIFGLLSGSVLLFLNLFTFPFPPGESGLIDLGPLTGLFWIIVIMMFLRGERIEKRAKHATIG